MAAKPAKQSAAKVPGRIPDGTKVSWHYRGAIGHGTVVGVAKAGKTSATTEYKVRETDHHPGEKRVLRHFGRALKRA